MTLGSDHQHDYPKRDWRTSKTSQSRWQKAGHISGTAERCSLQAIDYTVVFRLVTSLGGLRIRCVSLLCA
jgi:hypothetical protein